MDQHQSADRFVSAAVFVFVARFFIHIRNGIGDQADQTGADYLDARAAVGEAAKAAGELLRGEIHDGLADHSVVMTVVADGGDVVATIDMKVTLGPANIG